MVEQSELKHAARPEVLRVRGGGDHSTSISVLAGGAAFLIVGFVCLLLRPFIMLVAPAIYSMALLAVPLIAGGLAYDWARQRDRRDRPDDVVDEPIDRPMAEWLASIQHKLSCENPRRTWQRLARSIVRQGHAGTTVRVSREDDAEIPPPIEVSFEPIPLERCGPMAQAESPALGDMPPLTPIQWFARFGAVTVRASILSSMLMHGVMNSFFYGGSWLAFLFEFGKIYVPIAAVLMIWPTTGGVLREDQWLVVPRGLIRRVAWRWSAQPRVTHFDRESAALLVLHLTNERSALAVANDRDVGYAIGTKAEMDFVLRAWLSSVEPPRVGCGSELN